MTVPSQIAHYKITAKLGEGGMGAVYRATDTKLNREVAIKILPRAFAEDSASMQRFEREAQVLASLNHPNIASIYGIEQGAIVMELVEGEDLKGPLPVDTAIAYACQIAAGLEAAHEKGIVHRDLKPANIRVSADGTVKLLDFGLAKAAEPAVSASTAASPTQSPTLSLSMTQPGMILGTAAYMSPEQAKGKPVDKRADIWAFGLVLFEMLAGRAVYGGHETVTETLAAVILKEPDYSTLPAATPPRARALIERCLRKDPKQRLRDIGDARLTLDEPEPAANPGAAPATAPARSRFWMFLAALAASAALAISAVHFRERPTPLPVLRASLLPPPGVTYMVGEGLTTTGAPALSPDGRSVAFTARNKAGKVQLWVRALNSDTAQLLPGTEGAAHPFWSPDGRYIAFFADRLLKKIDAGGGATFTICPALQGRGGSWGKDNVIVFNPVAPGPLHRVSASGGTPTPVRFNGSEALGRFPWFLPDGRHFVYEATHQGAISIRVASIDPADDPTQNDKVVVDAVSNPMYSQGYLLYLLEDNLVAQSFDLTRLAVSGEILPVAANVLSIGNQRAGLFTASAGMLLYFSADPSRARNLVWLDRTGAELGVLAEIDDWYAPRFSPDASSIAIALSDNGSHAPQLWVLNAQDGSRTRLTRPMGDAPGSGSPPREAIPQPVWSPDGTTVAYLSVEESQHRIVRRKISSGTAQEEVVYSGNGTPVDFSPDGRFLMFERGKMASADSRSMLWVTPLDGGPSPHEPFRLVPNATNDAEGRFSPDGRFVVYSAQDSGQREVYVVPFSGGENGSASRLQVSKGGGTRPMWRKDGKEITFLAANGTVMSAEVDLKGTASRVSAIKPLFSLGAQVRNPGVAYDMTPDGQRFLVSRPVENTGAPSLLLIQNWPASFK